MYCLRWIDSRNYMGWKETVGLMLRWHTQAIRSKAVHAAKGLGGADQGRRLLRAPGCH